MTLFHPDYADPVNPADQVARLPGTDAPCFCREPSCVWPFCLSDEEPLPEGET